MSILQDIKNAVRSRSIHVSYVDVGSCNGCDIEVLACLAPRYDILLVIGSVTPQWVDKLRDIWEKIPEPKVAVAIGNCPISGCVYNRRGSLTTPPAENYIPIAASVPGCPPRPTEILSAILSVAPLIFKDYEEKLQK